MIEVIDNGMGIDNFDFLGKVYHQIYRKEALQKIKGMNVLNIWDFEGKLSIQLQG